MTSNNAASPDQPAEPLSLATATAAELAALAGRYLDVAHTALSQLIADPTSDPLELAVAGGLVASAIEARLALMNNGPVIGAAGAGKPAGRMPEWVSQEIASRAANATLPGPREGS